MSIFNYAPLADCLLTLTQNGISEAVWVSKYQLATESPAFFAPLLDSRPTRLALSLSPPPPPIPAHFQFQIAHFIDLLRLSYREPSSFSGEFEDLLTVLRLAAYMRVKSATKACVTELLKILKERGTLSMACECLEVGQLAVGAYADRRLVDFAEQIIVKQFNSIRLVLTNLEQYLDLPLGGIKAIIKSERFLIDSENSILYLVMVWILKDVSRKGDMMELLPYIQFTEMKKYFLVDIIPHVAEMFDKTIQEEISRKYIHALEYATFPTRYQKYKKEVELPLIFRQFLPEAHKFTFKCTFTGVSCWTLNTRQYSAPIFANGYEFHYFLRKQRITPPNLPIDENDTRHYTLAGFLRCTSKILPQKHYLPIASSVKIPLRGLPPERRFNTSKVIFEAPEKAIGGRLTVPSESWDQIIAGNNPMVNDDTIIVYISIEFLDDDEGCQIIQELTE